LEKSFAFNLAGVLAFGKRNLRMIKTEEIRSSKLKAQKKLQVPRVKSQLVRVGPTDGAAPVDGGWSLVFLLSVER
jgi:hypothetical protein